MLLAISSAAAADNYAYLTISQTEGDADYAVSNISKITFDTQNMMVHLTDGSEAKLPLAGLSKMFFSNSSTGIATLTAPAQISLRSGVLRVNAPQGSIVTVYDMGGKAVRTVTATRAETEVNLSGVQKGVYIVKVGSETKKIMNK